MKAKRFTGPNSRAVLQQVRAELGADAVILGNRALANGIEVLAVSNQHMEELISVEERPPRSAEPPAVPAGSGAEAMSFKAFLERGAAKEQAAAAPVAPLVAAVAPKVRTSFNGVPKVMEAKELPRTLEARERDALRQRDLLAEIHSMKGLLQQQMTALAWGESMRRRPLAALLLRNMLTAGFGAGLARALTERLPDDFSEPQALQWLHKVLARNLACEPEPGIIKSGGVYALVGPTGVGKTTTAAKLAARAVMMHGPQSLGLITTDCYRVGAQDQLRIYGKILGVPVLVAQDATDLEHAVAAMAGKHTVLIDTVGMSQRDERVAEQHKLLAVSGIKRLLLLNATAQKETLEDVVRAYVKAKTCGAVITKLDEAVKVGCALDVLIRHRLNLHFVTNGQRVPEDLHGANAMLLVHRALKSASPAASVPDDFELSVAIEESALAGPNV